MIEQPGLEYACARVQAALGGHPSEALWRQVESARDTAALLEAARASPFLTACTAGLTATSSLHTVESRLRGRLDACCEQLAGWLPREWHAACAWVRTLVHLPAVFHLYHGGAPYGWMHDEPFLAPYLDADLATRQRTIAGSALAPLAAHWSSGARLLRAWLAEWRRRRPQRADSDSLRALERAVEEHLAAFSATDPQRAWAERAALRARLARLLHAAVLEPAAAFAYLAIAALDVERLRAALVRCVLFAAASETAP